MAPPVLERAPREMEPPASGLLFHLAAGLFVLATLGLVALWTLKLVRAHRLERELDNAVAAKDYQVAVDRARPMQTAAPRLSRDRWKRREAELLLEWARHCLGRDDFAQAMKLTLEAGSAADRAGIDKDDPLRKTVYLTAAEATFGQVKQDWDSLATFDEQVSRCENFLAKYPDTPWAIEVSTRLAVVRTDKKKAEDDWQQMDAAMARLLGYAQVAEALDAARQYHDSRDRRDTRHIKLAARRIKEYVGYVKDGFRRLSPPVKFPPGSPLVKVGVHVSRPGADLFALYRLVLPSPQAAGGAACFSREQGMLYCLDAETGRLRWAIHQGLGAELEPALVDGAALCVAAWGRKLVRVDPQTGTVAWCVQLPEPVACDPVAVDKGAAVLDITGQLRIVDAATGNVAAQRDIGASWSKLVGDNEFRLALVAPSRAMLFERGTDAWVDVGAVLMNPRYREHLFLMGSYAAVLPMHVDPNAPAKRLFLWRSQGITALTTPAAIGNRWRLADHNGHVQVWIDQKGICHCTQLDSQSFYDPIKPLGNISTTNTRDGRLVKTDDGQGLLTISKILRFYRIDGAAKAKPFTSKWTLSMGQPRELSEIRVLPGGGDRPVVRGRDRSAAFAPSFARLQVAPAGKEIWVSRLGPNLCDPPGVCGSRAAWGDQEAGLWTLDASGLPRHRPTGLPGGPGDPVRVTADADGFVAHTGTQLMAFDTRLGRLWSAAANTAEKIAAVCLDPAAVAVLTAKGKLSAYSRRTGTALASPSRPTSMTAPAKFLAGGAAGRFVLAADDGTAVEASPADAAGSRTWRFRPLWKAPGGCKSLVRIETGHAVCGQGGWHKAPGASAGLADGLARVLHVEGDRLLVTGDQKGELAFVDLAKPAELWRIKTPAPPAWAVKLSGEKFALLVPPRSLAIVDRSRGSVIARVDLDGVPTAPPAVCGKSLWIPVSGYRLLKLPVAQLVAAKSKPRPATRPTSAPASRPTTTPTSRAAGRQP